MVTYTHSMILMWVAVVMSIVAAFTGLALTNNIASRPEHVRKTLVTMSSIVIGGGIWTMHFLAMLANSYSVAVGYDVVFTLGSGLISILVVGLALLVLHYMQRTTMVLNLAGLILAAGIVAMHYVGMSAMRGITPSYSLTSIVVTGVAGLVACISAVRVAYGKRSRDHIIYGGLLLGLSVVLVHYAAMWGTGYEVAAHSGVGTIAIANSTLAIVLVVAVFVICGAFLLVSATFLTRSQDVLAAAHDVSEEPDSETDKQTDNETDNETAASPAIRVPYERNRQLSYVASDDIGAIRADGRYTQLYTTSGVYFCPWSITEAEKNLQGTMFYRSHRSYLVNVPMMDAYEKRKDSGVCVFENIDQLSKVPVSRSRVAGLLDVLGHG